MRVITLIVIHCSAVRPNQTSSAKDIEKWHKDRGFKCIGYHYVVRRNGEIEPGRPEGQIGAHCVVNPPTRERRNRRLPCDSCLRIYTSVTPAL